MRIDPKIKLFVCSAVVVGTSSSLVGCGGGGGGNNAAPGPAAAVGAQLLALKSGDSWQYMVQGHEVRTDNTLRQIKSGSYFRSIQTATDGFSTLSLSESTSIIFDDTTGSTTSVLTDIDQDPVTGVVTQVADNLESSGNVETADNGPQTLIPGTWNASTGIASADSYSILVVITPPPRPTQDDPNPVLTYRQVTNQEHFVVTVVGQQVVTTPAGTFNTWKCNTVNQHVTTGQSINGVAYWAPQIGSFVQWDTVQKSTEGTLYMTYFLTKYSVH